MYNNYENYTVTADDVTNHEAWAKKYGIAAGSVIQIPSGRPLTIGLSSGAHTDTPAPNCNALDPHDPHYGQDGLYDDHCNWIEG